MAVKKQRKTPPAPAQTYTAPTLTPEEARAAAAMALGQAPDVTALTGMQPAAPVQPTPNPYTAAAEMALGQPRDIGAATGQAPAVGEVPTQMPGTSVTAPTGGEQPTTSTPVGSVPNTPDTSNGTPQSQLPAANSNEPDAQQIITKLLSDVGLGDLAVDIFKAMGETKISSNTSIDQLGYMIKDTDSYKKRFSANVTREAANKPAYSITQYLQLENAYKNSIQGRGIPSGFYDSYSDYSKFIENDISPAEIADRVDQGFRAVNEGDPEILRQLKEFYPDVKTGDLAAFFLDPTATTPLILNRAKAAQIGAQAMKQANMQLTEAEAQFVRQQGIEPGQAADVFGQIQAQQELYKPLAMGEEEISRQTQLEAATGNAQAQQRVAAKRRQRQAAFEAGGTFAAGKSGIAGLTTAQ